MKLFSFFGKDFYLKLSIINHRGAWLWGVGNRCIDGQYVLFLDYDGTPYDWIVEEIKLLQDTFYLKNFYLFKTKRGFHVINLQKHSLKELIDILNYTSADEGFRAAPLQYGRKIWTLRGMNKPDEEITYIGQISREEKSFSECSLPHRMYLQARFRLSDNAFEGMIFDVQKDFYYSYYMIPLRKL